MMTLPTPKESIMLLFEKMTLLFEGDKHPHLDLVYQFFFSDIDGGFPIYLRFSKGRAEFREGRHEHPSIVINTPSDVWLDIAGGVRNPIWAIITKKMKVEGDTGALRKLNGILTKKVDAPKSRIFDAQWTPPSRTLVLIGNPRKKNGLTSFYLQPFLEGMKTAGAEIEEIYLYDRKINPCLGCFSCWTKTPGICILKDDQTDLLKKVEKADLIVYALPLYVHGVPGLVKNHLDRQLPKYHPFFEKAGPVTRHPRRTQAKQSIALFSICGFPEMENFDALVKSFEAYARHDNFAFIARVLLPSAMETYFNPTARSRLIKKLDHLRDAGEQLVRQGSVRQRTLDEISKTPPLKNWYDGANMYWHDEMSNKRPAAS